MSTPLFYIEAFDEREQEIVLNENTSKHVVQVLRMKKDDPIELTDGKGKRIKAAISDDHKKRCRVSIMGIESVKTSNRKITIGISLLKNESRFEWFLEKATEIGVDEIIPLVCERTSKQKIRRDRLRNIIISAMLQSQQYRMPEVDQPAFVKDIISKSHHQQKFIAHCIEAEKRDLADLTNSDLDSQIILIGPEGDFTTDEVNLAIRHHFLPVSLARTRLRTETAGLVAATLLSCG